MSFSFRVSVVVVQGAFGEIPAGIFLNFFYYLDVLLVYIVDHYQPPIAVNGKLTNEDLITFESHW